MTLELAPDRRTDTLLRPAELAQACSAGGLGVWRWDAGSHRRVGCARADELLHRTIAGTDASPLPLETVHVQDREPLRQWFAELLEQPGTRAELDVRIVTPDATLSWVCISAMAVSDADGRPVAIAGTLADVTARRQIQADLEHQALHDPLTGLPNRMLLLDRLQQLVLSAERTGSEGALVIVDLNRFKDLNDTLGHEAGDVVLQEVAEMLSTSLRASDTVARMGGDEFAVLLPGTDADAARLVTAKLLARIRQPFVMDGLPVEATAGMVVFPRHGTEAATILRRAEIALYAAKRACIPTQVYSPEDDRHTAEQLTFVADLRRAIERGDLHLEYQPKVDARTGKPLGMEALIRWQHGRRLVPPDEFIPLAEQHGLIGGISRFVLDRALHQCAAWRELGIELTVAVNLSARELHDPALPATITALLSATGLGPRHLVLEITESSLLLDPERALGVLHQLRELGVSLAIDDFGTGYSSLAYLKRLPVGQLKIDRSFIRDIVSDTRDQAIVRSTIDLAHSLGLAVVGEGIEDAATYELLQRFTCDEIQGYYVHRPAPAAAITRWLLERGLQ